VKQITNIDQNFIKKALQKTSGENIFIRGYILNLV